MSSLIRLMACILVMWGVSGCSRPTQQSDAFPRRPIKLIVPFGAGGGSDTFGRIVQNAVEQRGLLTQPMVIINVPGAGGTIGSRRVKNALPDGYTLLLLHEGILTAKHSGSASYGPEAFTPIAGTGNATQVIAVSESSPHQDLRSLMDAAKARPDSIVFSANIGAPSHFAGLMLEAEKQGATFRYTQTGGGAKRFAALQGGHVDVSAFSIAEYIQFKPSGMRALALLGPDREPDLPDLATAREQGFDVISQNMQFWWAPLGTPDDRVAVIADALAAAMEAPEVREKLDEMKTTAVVLRGDSLKAEIDVRNNRIAAVAPSASVTLPDFALIAIGCLVILSTLSLVQALRRRKQNAISDANDDFMAAPDPLAASAESAGRTEFFAVGVLTILYVTVLQTNWVGFVPSTAVFTLASGGVLVGQAIRGRHVSIAKAFVSLIVVSVLMSVVMHYLFTNVLVVDLP